MMSVRRGGGIDVVVGARVVHHSTTRREEQGVQMRRRATGPVFRNFDGRSLPIFCRAKLLPTNTLRTLPRPGMSSKLSGWMLWWSAAAWEDSDAGSIAYRMHDHH
mgnify:CR=1 FL=1